MQGLDTLDIHVSHLQRERMAEAAAERLAAELGQIREKRTATHREEAYGHIWDGWRLPLGRARLLLAGTALGLGLGMLGSLAYAAIPGSGGLISACASNAGFEGQHVVTLLDTAQKSACASGQHLVTWGQAGPQGPQGPQGPKGDPGATHIIARSTTIASFRDGQPLEVSCNSGEVATGGGGHVSSDEVDQQLFNTGLTGGGSPGVITASEPVVTNGAVTGWRIKANRTLNATLVPLTAWVLCAS
jgi:hypothetical protein